MGVINAAALAILGLLLLRKLVSMERFFWARVFIITAFLCGLLLFGLSCLLSDPTCYGPIPPDSRAEFLCTEM